jgi:hypothetical protein
LLPARHAVFPARHAVFPARVVFVAGDHLYYYYYYYVLLPNIYGCPILPLCHVRIKFSMQSEYSKVLNIIASNSNRVEIDSRLKSLGVPGVTSHYHALRYLEMKAPVYVPSVVEYHVCKNDCVVFCKDFANLSSCPACGSPRFDLDGSPVRIFPYIPMTPRLRRMYGSEKWSKMIQDQFDRSTESKTFSDVHDGDLYKSVTSKFEYSKYTPPFFFGVDGITMDSQKELSVDPIALVNLFLPPELRTKSSFTTLAGLTPPDASNIKIFMQILLEEISAGFNLFDVLTGQWHHCQPILLFGTFDMRALPKATMGNQTPSKFACHHCHFKGTWCTAAHTTVYMGHQIFSSNAVVRERGYKHLPAGCIYKSPVAPVPPKRTKAELKAAGILADASPLPSSHKSHPCKKHFQQSSCYFAEYLEYWDPTVCLAYDNIHGFKNKGVDWAFFATGKDQSSKVKRKALKAQKFTARTGLQAAGYVLTQEERDFVTASCKSHRIPRSFGSSLRPFLIPDHISFLKCHDWKMVFSKLGVYHMRQAYLKQPAYRRWFFQMCNWSFNVHRRSYSLQDTFLWEEDIAVIISDAEGLYPTKFATCVTHYLVHIPAQLRNLGPLLCWGMYGY